MKNTNYSGSAATRELIFNQLVDRYGEKEAKNYNPETNCRTYKSWQAEGYRVKKGEKALHSMTIVEIKDESGEVVQTYSKRINLFFQNQVEKITA